MKNIINVRQFNFMAIPILLLIALLFLTNCSSDNSSSLTKSTSMNTDSNAQNQEQAAKAVYVYGYSLLTTYITGKDGRDQVKSVDTFKTLFNFKDSPTYKFLTIVRPNADTLYSTAWFDLSKSPVIFEVKKPITDVYFLVQVLDAYSNVVDYMGTNLNQVQPQAIFVRDGYENSPEVQDYAKRGYTIVKVPTSMGWILIRTSMIDGIKLAKNAQANYLFKPLYPNKIPAQSQKPKKKIPVYEQIAKMPPQKLLPLLAKLLVDNPPTEDDDKTGIIEQLHQLGITVGNPEVDSSNWDINAIKSGFAFADKQIINLINTKQAVKLNWKSNGWLTLINKKSGEYGTSYYMRAYYSYAGFGANSVEQAIYSISQTDSDNNAYDSSKTYLVHFLPNQLPPVNPKGFWSLTLYNGNSFFAYNSFLSPNKQIYSINSATDYIMNEDGSLDICVQRNKPLDNDGVCKLNNWLPAPTNPQYHSLIADKFSLTIRLYSPSYKADELSSKWTPPIVRPM